MIIPTEALEDCYDPCEKTPSCNDDVDMDWAVYEYADIESALD